MLLYLLRIALLSLKRHPVLSVLLVAAYSSYIFGVFFNKYFHFFKEFFYCLFGRYCSYFFSFAVD